VSMLRAFFNLVCWMLSFFLLFPVTFSSSAFASAEIVATTSYAADLVRVVACEKPELTVDVLVAPGSDPHSFVLLPEARGRIANAKLFLYVHSALEEWLPRKAQSKEKTWQELSAGLLGKPSAQKGGLDPHIWHSPSLTVGAADRLASRLGALYPARAQEFRSCFSRFRTAVAEEVVILKKRCEQIPKARRVLATNHDAFGYFAETFGFRVLTVQGFSTEASPTPARLRKVIDGVRSQGVKAVFLEASVPVGTMERVASEAGVKLGGSLYADGLGGPGSGAETTLDLWRKNVETVVLALK
jgi:ABC-type Zn uptake system ZnuABC Zn-binding protein ZnuA